MSTYMNQTLRQAAALTPTTCPRCGIDTRTIATWNGTCTSCARELAEEAYVRAYGGNVT